MEHGTLPRVLILTAGYGEGHNSAAKGVEAALKGRAETLLIDLCAQAIPATFKITRAAYLWIISHTPGLWKLMYEMSDKRDLAKKPLKGLGAVETLLGHLLDQWKPDVVISTYMIYPYMLDKLCTRTGRTIPYITVVTDSFVINKSWICAAPTLYAVTDPWTGDIMVNKGVSADHLRVTGFPVNPLLGHMSRLHPASWTPGQPFRVLYFAQRTATYAQKELEAMLEADPDIRVTCILGRKFRQIYPHIRALHAKYGKRLTILGWTRRVPLHLIACHAVVGKAGGATVHEVLATARPMLVNFLLPGQEEGNTRLLEQLGGGRHVPDPRLLTSTLQEMMADGGALWRSMHDKLLKADMTGGSVQIADLALNLAQEHTN